MQAFNDETGYNKLAQKIVREVRKLTPKNAVPRQVVDSMWLALLSLYGPHEAADMLKRLSIREL